MVVMFYFLLIRPQQRQRKELAARIAALQSGDRVVTTAGIHGIVHNVKEQTVILKVAEGTMLEFDKAAVATVQKKDAKRSCSRQVISPSRTPRSPELIPLVSAPMLAVLPFTKIR